MCPKSSLSISSDGMAAQLTSTNAAACRGERWWSARATSSLPVPFSPVISTRAAVGPTRSTSVEDFLERLAVPRHPVPGVGHRAQPLVLGGELALGQRVAQGNQQPVGVERLLQEIEGAALGRLHRGRDRAVARDHHHERRRVLLAQPGQRLQPVQPGHLHVEQDQVGVEGLVGQQSVLARRARPAPSSPRTPGPAEGPRGSPIRRR